MQYIESRKVSREEACGMYDVPPPVVQILDRATFSNITEQMRSQYRDTMAPRLKLDESVIDAQLRPDFDPQGVQYAEFLMDEVLRGAFEQRAAANQSAIFSGQRTPNEARRQDNLPPLPRAVTASTSTPVPSRSETRPSKPPPERQSRNTLRQ
jgi:HK97 family phage portal protein